jgi:hypothetical protein
MSGKGDKRRPTLVSMDKVDANWDKIFNSGESFSEQTYKVLNWNDDFETSVGALYPGARQEKEKVKEIGGRNGLDPTRYNDWEKDGKCVDF